MYAAFMVKYVSCIYAKKHRRRIYERRPNIIYVHIKNCIYFFIAGHIFSSDWEVNNIRTKLDFTSKSRAGPPIYLKKIF